MKPELIGFPSTEPIVGWLQDVGTLIEILEQLVEAKLETGGLLVAWTTASAFKIAGTNW